MSAFVHLIDQRRLIGPGGSTVSGSIYFYYTGTSVLAPVYQDIGLSVPSTNPIVVGAGDVVPMLFLDSSVEYRRVIIYSDGTQDEQDPIGTFFSEGELGLPIGAVIDYAGPTAPEGFLLCYGQEVSRVDYADLFAAVGTTYGAGNGSTTFNVPDYRGRVGAGKDNMGGVASNRLTDGVSPSGSILGAVGGEQDHVLSIAELPSHSHTITDPGHTHTYRDTFGGSGSGLDVGNNFVQATNPTGSSTTGITINNTGSGDGHNVVQPTIVTNKIIKSSATTFLSLLDLFPSFDQKANAIAIGIDADAVDMGAFTGSTIPDSSTAKAALQALETALESVSATTFTQSGAGAISQSLDTTLRRTVYVGQFGAVGNYNTAAGTGTDDSPAFAAAAASLGATGGRIIVDRGFKCLIDTNLTLPENVTIEGEGNGLRGKYNTVEAVLLDFGPTLYVNPSATITVPSSSGLRNLAVFRKGLQFNITSAQVASQFTGSAITISNLACDPIFEHLTIIGFQYGIRTISGIARANRVQIHHVNSDCINDIYLENAADTSRVSYVHIWPFVTVGSTAEANSAQLLRSGTGVHAGGTINDWFDAAHCFSYGKAIGYRVTGSVNSATFESCGADHVPGLSDGARGYYIDDTAREIRIINPQVAAKQIAIEVNSTYSGRTVASISNPTIWSVTTGILVTDGDVTVNGGNLRGGTSAIKTGASAGKVIVNGTEIRSFTTALDNVSTSVQLQHRNCVFNANSTIAVNPYTPTVASASSIILDGENDFFAVTGTTNCGTLSPVSAYAGKRVTLKFASGLQMINGGNMKLAGGVNFVVTADDTLTLASDGTTWYETGRSVN